MQPDEPDLTIPPQRKHGAAETESEKANWFGTLQKKLPLQRQEQLHLRCIGRGYTAEKHHSRNTAAVTGKSAQSDRKNDIAKSGP